MHTRRLCVVMNLLVDSDDLNVTVLNGVPLLSQKRAPLDMGRVGAYLMTIRPIRPAHESQQKCSS